jgi:hypothetical protein
MTEICKDCQKQTVGTPKHKLSLDPAATKILSQSVYTNPDRTWLIDNKWFDVTLGMLRTITTRQQHTENMVEISAGPWAGTWEQSWGSATCIRVMG